MIDLLLRVLLGIVVSIVAAAVLLPLAVFIGKLLRTAIGCETATVSCRWFDMGGWNVELADKVETAIIGGLIGGVVFASLSPALAPVMADLHVRSGIADTPEPAVSVHEIRGVSETNLSEQFDVRTEGNYSLYVVELHNDDNRVLTDYNLNVRFPGCVEATAMGATTFGTAVISNQTDQVQVGEFADRSANTTCYGAVQIEEFSASSSTLVTVLVDETPEENGTRQYPAPEAGEVLLTNSYVWEYNSRSYHEPPELVAAETEVHEY